MTDMWYKEVENYDWQTPGYAQNTAHFSQMVWKATTKLGVGFAQYKKDGNYSTAISRNNSDPCLQSVAKVLRHFSVSA